MYYIEYNIATAKKSVRKLVRLYEIIFMLIFLKKSMDIEKDLITSAKQVKSTFWFKKNCKY